MIFADRTTIYNKSKAIPPFHINPKAVGFLFCSLFLHSTPTELSLSLTPSTPLIFLFPFSSYPTKNNVISFPDVFYCHSFSLDFIKYQPSDTAIITSGTKCASRRFMTVTYLNTYLFHFHSYYTHHFSSFTPHTSMYFLFWKLQTPNEPASRPPTPSTKPLQSFARSDVLSSFLFLLQ